MKEQLIKFFEEYKTLFQDGMSSGDAQDTLMDLMCIVGEDDVEDILNYLKTEE